MDGLIWIDLETTGLIPNEDHILEIGFVITDMQLNELARLHKYDLTFSRGYEHLEEIVEAFLDDYQPDKVVVDMHTASGLWTDLDTTLHERHGEHLDHAYNSRMNTILSTFVRDAMDQFGLDRLYPAGSSVHFDIAFLNEWYPDVTSILSHRHLDVTSLKLASTVANGDYPRSNSDTAHRVFDDIRESMEWFQNYIYPEESVSVQARHLAKVVEDNG